MNEGCGAVFNNLQTLRNLLFFFLFSMLLICNSRSTLCRPFFGVRREDYYIPSIPQAVDTLPSRGANVSRAGIYFINEGYREPFFFLFNPFSPRSCPSFNFKSNMRHELVEGFVLPSLIAAISWSSCFLHLTQGQRSISYRNDEELQVPMYIHSEIIVS
ncbi:hypothetical protein KP509_31G064700 [Ceratopteris richardii]|uniref:Uncharacterized protein n=1 Tax=Ceratopteris richardii TaxID=49495 RepID=A0A8T2R016_CERRI|nr:hypothetical protein KP509_31G064700 [Ceratopteris richardii]